MAKIINDTSDLTQLPIVGGGNIQPPAERVHIPPTIIPVTPTIEQITSSISPPRVPTSSSSAPIIPNIIPPSPTITSSSAVEEPLVTNIPFVNPVIQSDDSITKTLPNSIQVVFDINLNVVNLSEIPSTVFTVNMQINPELPSFGIDKITETEVLRINRIDIPLEKSFLNVVETLVSNKIETYFDNDRVLKTLLNFGTDYQTLLTNWKYDSTDITGKTIVVKTHTPISQDISTKDFAYISRELITPVVNKIYVLNAPAARPNVYLRPANKKISITGQYGNSVNNVTLQNLLTTSSFRVDNPTDPIVEEWFVTSLEGAELNVDYSNFKNFVFFGSAEKRLYAFKNKLQNIENLNTIIQFNSSSIATSSLPIFTSSVVYQAIYDAAEQKQDILRTFDGYERFLYYESSVPMSGTFGSELYPDQDDEFYYVSDITWPKISGSIAPIASSSAWYTTASAIASEYDSWNVNRFVNNLPEYIVNDEDSQEYMTFFDLVGHMFDTIKLYINQMPNMFDRGSDPSQGLSMDMVWDIATAYGIELPNQYAIKNLLEYTLGISGSTSTYRQFSVETWRRFLHNQIYTMKSKGTRTSLRSLMNSYGILPTTLQIRETSTPSYLNTTQSFETYEENTTVLSAVSGSYISIPWSSSVGNVPRTIQMRFSAAPSSSQVLFNLDSSWAATVAITTGSYGRVEIVSSSITILSSSYQPMALSQFYNIMIETSGSNCTLYFKQSDDDGDLLVNDVQSTTNLVSTWNSPTTLYLGGSGSLFGPGLNGYIDEFRIWGEYITEETFDKWVKYPGLYNGNDYTSSAASLWVRLSFNKPQNLGSSSLIQNESPYQRNATAPSNMAYFSASSYSNSTSYPYNMVSTTRMVQRLSPTAGGTQYDSNKIVIADSPSFTYTTTTGIPVLRKDMSIVSVDTKINEYRGANNVVGLYFSPTDAINDSIIRSIGNVDLHDYVGDPRYLYSSSYDALDVLNKYYWDNYSYSYNTNSFIRFVKDLLGPLFEQAKDLVPTRAKLLAGIVIEPTILERYRYPLKPVQNEDENLLNLEISDSLKSNPTQSAEYITWESLITVGDDTSLLAEDTDNSALIDLENIQVLTSELTTYVGAVSSSDVYSLNTEYLDLYDILKAVDSSSIFSEKIDYDATLDLNSSVYNHAALAIQNLPYESPYTPTYGPVSDLELDIAASTYFTIPNGLVAVPSYTYVRYKQSILTDQGTWTPGTVYHKNDMVTQPTTITDSRYTTGNGKEFYAIADSFISNVPPFGDPSRWRAVTYIPSQFIDVRKAVYVSGSVSIVPTGSSLPGIVGYAPQHYKFSQPNYTAFKRSRYTGCIQTIDTTLDGKEPVEVLISSAETLVVLDNTLPVIKPENTEGPILDVQ